MILTQSYPMLGFDEVGRGSLAGPVAVGGVFLSKKINIPDKIIVKDSKLMTKNQRRCSAIWLKLHVIFAIGICKANIIDQIGISKAVVLAAKKAKDKLDTQIMDKGLSYNQVFVDGNQHWFKNDHPIVKGDQKILAISMSAILAKVYRDKLMADLDLRYQGWRFANHVGYGTKYHRQMIIDHGLISGLHRKSFCQKILSKNK